MRPWLHQLPILLLLALALVIRADEVEDDALKSAASDGNIEEVRHMLQRAPSKDAVNKSLYFATLDGHSETALLLIEGGANVNFRFGPKQDTPLSNAASINDVRVMQALLEHHANPNSKCDIGWTPLIHAASHGHLEAVILLAGHSGTRINAHDNQDFTALMTAVFRGHVAVVEYLLTTRADPTVKSDRGETALDIARAASHANAAAETAEKASIMVGLLTSMTKALKK